MARWRFPAFRRPWRARARRSSGTVTGHAVVVLKPQTYMNRSGAALRSLTVDAAFDPTRDLLVMVDEVALPLGSFRIRARGSAGGHNGLRSIEGALQTQEYARLRIGVGPVPDDYDDRSDFVLGAFARAEREAIDTVLPVIADAVECWIGEGVETAMNRFNRMGKAE